jgi:branched-chain amino acid transport system substrate-binding protein
VEKHFMRIRLLIVCLTALTIVLSSCDMKQTPKATEPYKIGAVLSISGGASFLGNPEKKTLEMLVDKLNSKGGINGQPIQLIIRDSKSSPAIAAEAVKRLATEDNVLAIIGPSTSGATIESLPLSLKYEIPIISCAASHKIVQHRFTRRPYSWVFKTAQSDSMAVEAIYAFMQSKNIKRIGVISIKSGYGLSGLAELTRLAMKYGIEIVANEKYQAKEKDFTSVLKKIKRANPQAIVNWSIGPTQVSVVRAWKDLGMNKTLLFQSHGFGSLKNVQLAGGAAEGVFLPLGAVNIANILPDSHPQKKVTMQYTKSFRDRYKEPVNSFGGHAWDAFTMLVNALEKAGSDKNKIREEIENTKEFVGQGGVFNMSLSDHSGLDRTAFNMIVVKNNTWALAR